jgi:hypothetical protein
MTTDAILHFPRTPSARTARRRAPRPEELAMIDLRLQTVADSTQPADACGACADGVSPEEWQRRFMAHIHAVSGFNVNAATTWPEGYRGLSRGFETDPEAAASAHLSCWLD